jgi:actin-related protein 6
MGSSKARSHPRDATLKAKVKAQTHALPAKVFVVDNGAYTLKAGYAPSQLSTSDEDILSACASVPNAIAKTRNNRVYVGPQLNNITDWNEATFRRPVEKGYIVNWEGEKEIWEQSFFTEDRASVAPRSNKQTLRIADPEQTTLILTEAPNALPALQRNADEIVMEEWGFGGYLRCLGMPFKLHIIQAGRKLLTHCSYIKVQQ